jgi:hypothetical protein
MTLLTKEQLEASSNTPTYAFTGFPQPVGFWRLYDGNPCTKFAMYQKPTDEQIENTARLLGWIWEEAKHD